jgi:hypothetical protein
VGHKAVLDAVVKRKIPSPYRDSNLLTIQPVDQSYTAELTRLLPNSVHLIHTHTHTHTHTHIYICIHRDLGTLMFVCS